jgi:hypothetical protein
MTSRFRVGLSSSVVGQDYVIPLSSTDSQVTPLQLPRLESKGEGSVDVPLFSDLKRHGIGACLSDPGRPFRRREQMSRTSTQFELNI